MKERKEEMLLSTEQQFQFKHPVMCVNYLFGLLTEPPSLEDAGKMLNETVVVNNPIQLECKAAGNPLPGMFTCGLCNLLTF